MQYLYDFSNFADEKTEGCKDQILCSRSPDTKGKDRKNHFHSAFFVSTSWILPPSLEDIVQAISFKIIENLIKNRAADFRDLYLDKFLKSSKEDMFCLNALCCLVINSVMWTGLMHFYLHKFPINLLFVGLVSYFLGFSLIWHPYCFDTTVF